MLCFAYGMNLDPEYMPPGAEEVGPAVLPNWKLVFRGVADVEPAEGEQVHGALWELDTYALESIDAREGYRPGDKYSMYDRITVSVTNEAGEQVEALVYTMMRKWELRAPGDGYFGLIRNGYKHFGLPLSALHKTVQEAIKAEKEELEHA